MKDTTKLAGGERGPEAEKRTGGPRLARKMLEGMPERAGRREIEELRGLSRGMPAEVTTADGEKVTLFMSGPRGTTQEERELDARVDELGLKLDIIALLHGMPRDVRDETIAALCGTHLSEGMLILNMAPRNSDYIGNFSLDEGLLTKFDSRIETDS